MFAVIKSGGKQYRVAKGDLLTVEKLDGATGDAVAFEDVLAIDDDGAVTIGAPAVAGAGVVGTIVEQAKGEKILVFKKRRRQNSRRLNGHRQEHTVVRITDVLARDFDRDSALETARAATDAATDETTSKAKPAAGKAAAKKTAAKKAASRTSTAPGKDAGGKAAATKKKDAPKAQQ